MPILSPKIGEKVPLKRPGIFLGGYYQPVAVMKPVAGLVVTTAHLLKLLDT
jgi:hypothetical protein